MSVSMKQLKKAIREVELEKAPKPGSGKNRKRNAKRKAKKQAAQMGVPGAWSAPTMSTSLPASWTMAHREYMGQFKLGSDGNLAGSFFLSPYTFPWLAKLSACFEKYQWVSLALEYIPDVGTTMDGSIALGVDWGTTNASVGMCSVLGRVTSQTASAYDRSQVLALTPSQVSPFWKPARMTLPVAQLQSRRWYTIPTEAVSSSVDDFGPGFLAYVASASAAKGGVVVGDVWVSYKVVLAGTRKP